MIRDCRMIKCGSLIRIGTEPSEEEDDNGTTVWIGESWRGSSFQTGNDTVFVPKGSIVLFLKYDEINKRIHIVFQNREVNFSTSYWNRSDDDHSSEFDDEVSR